MRWPGRRRRSFVSNLNLENASIGKVSKMFDWHDGRVDNMDYKKEAEEEEFEKKKKEELKEKVGLEVHMEKLKLAKVERCIL
ncbi:hypothetical protein ZWY2020_036341 [Hordeum vulgare]|nr:hypothetical protein ZWY2020_036341 [Hordeum vulgare]